jgi:rod shape-determining protein MreC
MQQIVFFIQKYKFFLFFLLLEIIAFSLIVNNNSFQRSKFVSSTNAITGDFYKKSAQASEYFSLEERNNFLVEENTFLKNKLDKIYSQIDSTEFHTVIDTSKFHQKYEYISSKIIKNEFHKSFNFLLLDKGKNDTIFQEMAVINSKGVLGITDAVGSNYARVQSIINKNSRINARLKNSYHFGTLTWDGKDYNVVQLTDIPRQAEVSVGDTIITDGKSTIFPEGILIGKVLQINTGNSASNSLDIKLFNDMSNIGNAYIIRNFEKLEIEKLENPENE